MSYDPRFDFQLPYGEKGESIVRDLLLAGASTFEVKRKRYLDFKFYVETMQRPKGAADYKFSGMNTTEADYWAYVVADTGVVVLMPTDRLREAAMNAPKAEERDGDNPTKGRLVTARELFPYRDGLE
jgi:hypothetical protein